MYFKVGYLEVNYFVFTFFRIKNFTLSYKLTFLTFV